MEDLGFSGIHAGTHTRSQNHDFHCHWCIPRLESISLLGDPESAICPRLTFVNKYSEVQQLALRGDPARSADWQDSPASLPRNGSLRASSGKSTGARQQNR